MPSLSARSLTPSVNRWLATTRQPRILHVFDRACNLINDRREVLSIVTPQIGDGPFSLVVEDEICFSEYLNLQSQVSSAAKQLSLGDFTIDTSGARLWNPRPDWEKLHARRDDIARQLTKVPVLNYRPPGLAAFLAKTAQDNSTIDLRSSISNLCSTLVNANISAVPKITSRLAGLGAGLTPAGDDFIIGAIHAAWIIHPQDVALALTREIANTAASLTTSLSAAWLRSAVRGEAGNLWHGFFDALISGDIAATRLQITKLLTIGHTSGEDALAGFFSTVLAYCNSQNPLNF